MSESIYKYTTRLSANINISKDIFIFLYFGLVWFGFLAYQPL